MARTSLNGKFNSGAMRGVELFDDNNNNFPAHKTYPRLILCDSIHDRERAGRVVWGRPFPWTDSDTRLLKVIDVLASVDSSDRRTRSAASGGCDCSGRARGLLEKKPLFLFCHCIPFLPAGWQWGGHGRWAVGSGSGGLSRPTLGLEAAAPLSSYVSLAEPPLPAPFPSSRPWQGCP